MEDYFKFLRLESNYLDSLESYNKQQRILNNIESSLSIKKKQFDLFKTTKTFFKDEKIIQ